MLTHTDDFRVAGDRQQDLDYVYKAFNDKFTIKAVTNGVMLGVKITHGTDENGVRYISHTQTAYTVEMYETFKEYMPTGYKVTTPFPADTDARISLLNKDGTCNRPDAAEAARNHDRGYRTGVGMLYWLNRNTMIALSTGLNYLSRVMQYPSDHAFDCMLHMVQWCYQERDNGIVYRSDSSIVPTTWYDASNDTDPADSLAIGGGLTLMCGATVISTCGKLLHVGNAGSSHTEYMQLERSTRSILWVRQLLQTMQIFRSSGHVASSGNFVRSTRLYNSTPSYIDSITGRVLRWITQHDSGEPPGRPQRADSINLAGGVWAIISELGTGDIIAFTPAPTGRGRHGPADTNIWLTLGASGDVSVDVKIRVYDAIGAASIVSTPSLLIGDNITAKKWASIDTVTPGNKHIRIAYHWVKEHVRDQDIDLRDTPSAANLADFLTKNQTGPQIRASTDAASGYASPPAIPASA